ncbi:orotidine-5'-phosphate decarboxylase [Pseudohalioglobus sediminis]|uniref:Orotidine 5'-phosphate decarboxylase n=1 Tax=Pseudohalioglobus sediminis TaxID=2606449 RepID=A0A5B0X295_9GAMM|nr:orotidine-5'-phosphate decarboxylase [Pseudohalioglobus sediminis]KAA1192431.1 orotidine-5'-phosphate decarboxylase [Pseudohalioglobus sediminis]
MNDKPVIVALDFPAAEPALELAARLSPELCRLKVGKELFTRAGPQLVESLQDRGFEIFLDLKFHDIPNTVAGAVRSAAELGVWMVNVHAGGGRRMMEAAKEALQSFSTPPLLIAVTILTSMSDEDLRELGYTESAGDRVMRLAALTRDSGLDGVVCSAMEAPALRRQMGADFCLVTPGIRLQGDDAGDQRRVLTPAAALASGSDYLVIGRSITGADEPLAALERVHRELAASE